MNEAKLALSLLAGMATLVATGRGRAEQRSLPTPATPSASSPAPRAGTTSETALPLRQCIDRALRNNPSYRLARLDVKSARQAELAEAGRFPYTYQANASYTRSEFPRLGPNDSVNASTTRSVVVGSALRRTFSFGTTAEVRVQGERFDTLGRSNAVTAAGAAFPTTGYTTTFRASVSQPLLRGAGNSVGEQSLRTARASHEVAKRSVARVKSALVRDVVNAYHELWYAQRAERIEKAALKLALRQESDARGRLAVGAIAAADTLSFETRSAQLKEAVIRAGLERRRRSLTIGTLMGESTPRQDLLAATPKALRSSHRKVKGIARAMRRNSVELAELSAAVKLARTRAQTAGDSSRPRLDLEGYAESNGVSERIPTSIGRASRIGWWSVNVGAVFELPLDTQRKRAERTNARLAVTVARTQLKRARQQIGSDAALAVANANTAAATVRTARKTLKIAVRARKAERERFALGRSLPIQIQVAEEDVRRARLRVARAYIDLALARTALMHLTGELVKRYSA